MLTLECPLFPFMISQPFPPPPAAAAANANGLASWMANANPPSSVQSAILAASASSLPFPQNQGKIMLS